MTSIYDINEVNQEATEAIINACKEASALAYAIAEDVGAIQQNATWHQVTNRETASIDSVDQMQQGVKQKRLEILDKQKQLAEWVTKIGLAQDGAEMYVSVARHRAGKE